jgi:diguanylate cyclase
MAIKNDSALERERQRSSLLDWENKLLFSFRFRGYHAIHSKLVDSEFGMWLTHKSKILFDEMEDVQTLFEVVDHIDKIILPQLDNEEVTENETIRLFEELKSKLDLIRYIINDLFERLGTLEQGKDSVTGLYNRRYLGAVLTREIQHHTLKNKSFGVMLIKIGNLEIVATTDEARQILLKQFAISLVELVRTSDYIFRYGSTDFLIVAVETTKDSLKGQAEILLEKITKHQFITRINSSVNLMVSFGVAQHDGHPDYMGLLRKAEHAVIKASVQGKNRMEFYDENEPI